MKRLSLEDVARYPRPGMSAPRHVEFTPDSRKVAYLFSEEGTLVQQLWTYDVDIVQFQLLYISEAPLIF